MHIINFEIYPYLRISKSEARISRVFAVSNQLKNYFFL